MSKHMSLTEQTRNMNVLLSKGINKDRYASGVLVTVNDLNGEDIIYDTMISGEYSKALFTVIGQLLSKTMQESVVFYKDEVAMAEKVLDEAYKQLANAQEEK
jgi:hypothetical protein